MRMEKAAGVLGVEIPIKFADLKSAFRRLAMFAHPDRGGDAERFREVEAAYRLLCDEPAALVVDDAEKKLTTTVDGTPLSKLGRGFPITVSAKTCAECDGRGYRPFYGRSMQPCPDCHETGWKHVPCRRCGGTGKFRKNGRVVGECYGCGGTGEFVPHNYAVSKGMKPDTPSGYWLGELAPEVWPRSHYCPMCDGSGSRLADVEQVEYAVKCGTCDGIGELKMFNPCLPRGLLRGGV